MIVITRLELASGDLSRAAVVTGALARGRIARETRTTGRLTLKPNASLLVLLRAEEDDHEEIAFGRRGRGDCLDRIVGQ